MANFRRYFFIMPTLARFEREAHERVERGEGLTAELLIGRMAELFAEGYGREVEVDHERVGITWAQFSHLYEPFYVFQYATGISGANALARGVLAGRRTRPTAISPSSRRAIRPTRSTRSGPRVSISRRPSPSKRPSPSSPRSSTGSKRSCPAATDHSCSGSRRAAVALNDATASSPSRRARRASEASRHLGDDRADADARAVPERDDRADRGADVVDGRVVGDLARERDLPGVDGEADPPAPRFGAPRRAAGVEHDLREAVGPWPRESLEQVCTGEAGHERVRRSGDELGRRTRLQDAPVDEDADAIGERGRILEVVGDENRRQARSRRSSCSWMRTSAFVWASSAESGSSRRRTRGSWASARASATR